MGRAAAVKLLLDTHILLWSLLDPHHLTQEVVKELENAADELWISPVTTWEILVLAEKGRVILEPDRFSWVRAVFTTIPFKEALLNHEVAIESRLIDLPHQDPADRFLAATARVYGLTLVTADDRLLHSTKFSVLPNR
jgi:PIN domain nuclease of toxin-antitoxin system